MCTVTLELPDELAALAQKNGLLTSSALEAYIRKSLTKEVRSPSKPAGASAPKLSFAEAQQKIRALGVELSVDRMLQQKHDDLAHELAIEAQEIN
jgi:hypothetical protein